MKKEDNILLLKDIKSPKILSTLDYKQLENLASQIRQEIIDSTSINGGHLSSNLGVVELTISLHRNFDFTKDKLLFDVGHQCYTHKLLTGRSINKLRKKDGVSGFIKMNESKYDIFEAGHSSTSLSAALAFAIDRDNKLEDYKVISLIGDASIANGVAFEALNNIPSSKHKVIIVLNDNDMAISTPVGGLNTFFRALGNSSSYSMIKKGFKKILFVKPIYNIVRRFKNWIKRHLIATNMFDSLGFGYIGIVDGHDFKALDAAFKKAKRASKSVVVHVRTKKGKGYEFAENDTTGYWHGVTPFNKETGKPKNFHPNEISWSHLYSDFVLEKLKTDDKFYLIGVGTLKGSGLENACEQYPGKVLDTGISEEHAFILASELAQLGYHVCISVYSTFMQRAFDQISHDIARVHSPVTVLVDRSGLVGSDGDTHQGIYDSAFLFSTPYINVNMARTPNDAYTLFNESFKNKEATFIRYPRTLVSKVNIDKKHKINDYTILRESSNNTCAIISVGPLTDELMKSLKNRDVTVINPLRLKPISKGLITEISKYQNLVIYTPYETSNGFAQALIEEITIKGLKSNVFVKAVPLTFVSHKTVDEQLEEFNLLPSQVADFINKIVKEK